MNIHHPKMYPFFITFSLSLSLPSLTTLHEPPTLNRHMSFALLFSFLLLVTHDCSYWNRSQLALTLCYICSNTHTHTQWKYKQKKFFIYFNIEVEDFCSTNSLCLSLFSFCFWLFSHDSLPYASGLYLFCSFNSNSFGLNYVYFAYIFFFLLSSNHTHFRTQSHKQ